MPDPARDRTNGEPKGRGTLLLLGAVAPAFAALLGWAVLHGFR